MNTVIEIDASLRTNFGTGAARELRCNGKIPAIIYGCKKQPIAIAIDGNEITKYYRKPCFISSVIKIKLGSDIYKILPKAVDLHPVTDVVRHVDFVFLDEKIQKMEVPVVYEGRERAIGVKRGGFFNIIKRRVMLLCDINHIPRNIIIDVSNMPIGDSIKSPSVKLPEHCSFYDKKDFVLATIIGRKGSKSDVGEEGAN
jgi:large subunit ribosomal protein L25